MFITDVITLDPAVISKKHSSAIEDNFITSAKPSTVQPYAGTCMTISNSSTNWGTSKAFVKFLDSGLPLIDSSYYVTKAYFSVMTKSAPTTAASILLKEVLGSWSSQTITYNNAPAFFNSSNRVNTIYSPGFGESGACGFEYDASGRLTRVWELAGQPGTENVYYTYDANSLLLSATNCDGVKVTYEYYTTREPFRVKRVRITGGTLCAYDRTYEYKDCLTVVTDNLSGKKLFYHFNDYGNCISVNDQLGYAAFAKYSDSNPVNHPETISKMQRSVVNLLKNHNFESSDGWSFTNANSAAGNTIDYSTDSPHMGTRCVKATVVDGFRCDMQQWVTLERGKTYICLNSMDLLLTEIILE